MEPLDNGQAVTSPMGQITIKRVLSKGIAYSYLAISDDGTKLLFKMYSEPVPHPESCPWFPKYEQCQKEIQKKLAEAKSHLIQLHAAFIHDGTYCQVIEWAEGQELETVLERLNDSFTFDKAMKIARVMVFGIAEMHRVGIIHEDLKPDNVWLQEDSSIGLGYRVKICDFDWSFIKGAPAPWGDTPGAGTDGYRSPEHFRNQVPTQSSDMFTVGLMLYELFTGTHPLDSVIEDATTGEERDCAIIKAINNGTIPPIANVAPERTKELDSTVIDCITRCFSSNPDDRPTAKEMHAALLANGSKVPPTSAVSTTTSKRLVLFHRETEMKWRIQEPTKFSRQFCTRMFNVPAEYVAREQGEFSCNSDKSKWFIEHGPTATNATMINSSPITVKTELLEGMKVQIGNPETGNIVFELEVMYE